LAGFNSIFAVASIDVAKKYYTEFKKQMEGLPVDKQLKVATIYSFTVNENDPEVDGIIDDECPEDTSRLDARVHVISWIMLSGIIIRSSRQITTHRPRSSKTIIRMFRKE
jgi:type I site-specific restriction-modification system R (restriction) subunit